jgi:hypothetical protein
MLQFRRITTQERFIRQIDGLGCVRSASVFSPQIYAALEHRVGTPVVRRHGSAPPGPFVLHVELNLWCICWVGEPRCLVSGDRGPVLRTRSPSHFCLAYEPEWR